MPDGQLWFIKTLSATDAQKSRTHAWRILVPKGEVSSAIFPQLDEDAVNPEGSLEVVSGRDGSTHTLGFAYYNTKNFWQVSGERDEYGLLRVAGLIASLGGASAGDTFVLERNVSGIVTAHIRRPGRAWLVIASGDDRAYGGNDGYTDEPDAYYSWDTTVPHHRNLAIGDRIVLWDKTELIGYSAIESIDTEPGMKMLRRCPKCTKSRFKARKNLEPTYKCQECSAEFDQPTSELKQVTNYRSRHDAAWVDAKGALSAEKLRSLCESPESQQSIRPLAWDAFSQALAEAGLGDTSVDVDGRVQAAHGGHKTTTTRVRIGQGKFRTDTIKRYGANCALTGPAPEAVLEAAHLYSFAEIGLHLDHGGIPLRRDIHRLFDLGDIAVDPTDKTINICKGLMGYPTYAVLNGQPIHVELSKKQVEWVKEHWAQHRTR